MKIYRHAINIIQIIMITVFCTMVVSASNGPEPQYEGETILEFYSFDYTNRSYHPITDTKAIVDITNQLEKQAVSYTFKSDSVGFLIITNKGKYPFYFSESNVKNTKSITDLISKSKKHNTNPDNNVQWLCYMSVDKIKKITFNGAGGGAEYSLDTKKYPTTKNLNIEITDKEQIKRTASYLKGIKVDTNPTVIRGRSNFLNSSSTFGMYSINIYFDNDVSYTIYGPFLTITSSDLDEQISYSGDDKEILKLRDFMMEL